MASSYPTGLDSFATNRVDGTDMGDDTPGSVAVGTHAGDHNNLADAVNKIEAELGTNPSGASATVAAAIAAAVPLSVVDAAGDLVVGSANDAVTRLGKGSDGQWLRTLSGAVVWDTFDLADLPTTGATEGEVLTYTSGAPAWNAVSVTLVGAKVYRGSDKTLGASSTTTIDWDNEEFDTDTIHDNSTNPSRLTIPANKGGKYKLFGHINVTGTGSTQVNRIDVFKNGSSVIGNFYDKDGGSLDYNLSDVFDLAAGDYIELRYVNAAGGAHTMDGGANDSRVGLYRLG